MTLEQRFLRRGVFSHTRHRLTTQLCGLLLCVLLPWNAYADLRLGSSPVLNLLDVNYESALIALQYGQYAQADQLLRRVIAQDPDNLGAYLDLAVVACRRGNKTALNEALNNLEQQAHSPLPEGIAEVVAFFRESPCHLNTPKVAQLYAQLSVGHSSNANLAPDSALIKTGNTNFPVLRLGDASRPQRSAYAQASAAYIRKLSSSWEVLAQAYARNYLQDTDADAAVMSIGVAKTSAERRLELSSGVTTLDNQLQQRFVTARLLQNRHDARVSITQRSDIDDTEFRATWLIQVTPKSTSWRFRVGPLLDLSERRPGGDRAGLELQAEAWSELGAWRGYHFIGTQWLMESSPYSPVFGDTKRRSLQSSAQTRWEWTKSDYAPYITLSWLHQRDQIALFNYQSVGIEVGVQLGR